MPLPPGVLLDFSARFSERNNSFRARFGGLFYAYSSQGVNVDDYGNELPATTVQQINRRFGEGSERMAGIERELAAERRELQELKGQLADLLDFFAAMKGAFKVLNWVGKVAKPVAAIVSLAAAMGAAYAAWRGAR